MMKENTTITQTQLMDKMTLTSKQIQTDKKELQEEGLLVREGFNRNGKWIVKSKKQRFTNIVHNHIMTIMDMMWLYSYQEKIYVKNNGYKSKNLYS